MYPETECFVINVIGEQQSVAAMWDGQCARSSLHVARQLLSDVRPQGELEMPDILAPDWDGFNCSECGAPCPAEDQLKRSGGLTQVWDTPDGRALHPGAMYLTDHNLSRYPHRCFHWDNCDGRHLHVVLPNGHPWDVDSRANNCDRPDDRTHRCWVREGEMPHVTAGKAGDTCSAGAGSILAGDYHGFLRDGVLTAG